MLTKWQVTMESDVNAKKNSTIKSSTLIVLQSTYRVYTFRGTLRVATNGLISKGSAIFTAKAVYRGSFQAA